MLAEFQGHFNKPTYAKLQTREQADFKIERDPNGKIPFRSPYCISLRAKEELQRQIGKEICCGWI
jgi:hypothetical protein